MYANQQRSIEKLKEKITKCVANIRRKYGEAAVWRPLEQSPWGKDLAFDSDCYCFSLIVNKFYKEGEELGNIIKKTVADAMEKKPAVGVPDWDDDYISKLIEEAEREALFAKGFEDEN